MTGNGSVKRLRFLTYLTPDIPLDTFCLLRNCIEEASGLETDLIVEDRYTGPQQSRADPFTANNVDIMALHTSDYLRLKTQGYNKMELCPAAPIHKHQMTRDRPVYFSEVIIHASNRQKYKGMRDLKGCSWAYNNEDSLSGNLIMLKYLKNSLGANASYFGNVMQSGNHLNSIKMVRDYRAEAAAVNSVVLAGYIREHEDCAEKIVSVLSLGPLPIYPLLFNIHLSDGLKQRISEALLQMHKSHAWASKLNDVGITKYTAIDANLYRLEEDLPTGLQGSNIKQAYY
ncbi:hypothetical protein BsWGS_21353 [Bradybaena similaris]